MNVRELIERLEDLDPEATVLLAHQPSWPLQFNLQGVASSFDLACYAEDEEYDDTESVVYLAEGDHPDHPYAPSAVWEVAS